MLTLVHQMHTYIGYAATYLLTLALLLAPKTANDPKIDNYTIVLCVLPPIQPDLIAEFEIAAIHIGFCSEFGGVGVHHRESQVADHWSSHIPATSSGTSSTKGPELPYSRMEAGNEVILRPKNVSYLLLFQIWVALKTYKHLPHTFMYIFAFFFLSDVSTAPFELVGFTECAT